MVAAFLSIYSRGKYFAALSCRMRLRAWCSVGKEGSPGNIFAETERKDANSTWNMRHELGRVSRQ